MSAETQLATVLKAATAVTTLVAQRIYPDNVPQAQPIPCVSFTRTGTEYVHSIHGSTLGSKASLEVWCMATTRKSADEIADAVTAAATAAGFTPTGRRAEFDPETGETGLWGAVLTVDYWQ